MVEGGELGEEVGVAGEDLRAELVVEEADGVVELLGGGGGGAGGEGSGGEGGGGEGRGEEGGEDGVGGEGVEGGDGGGGRGCGGGGWGGGGCGGGRRVFEGGEALERGSCGGEG